MPILAAVLIYAAIGSLRPSQIATIWHTSRASRTALGTPQMRGDYDGGVHRGELDAGAAMLPPPKGDVPAEVAMSNVEAARAATLRDDPPIPLDDDEWVFFAAGPRDLPSRLAEFDAPVRKVSPDSDLELY